MSYVDIILDKARSLRSSGDAKEARRLLEGHTDIFTDDPDFNSLLGQLCEQLGDNQRAIEFLEKAVAHDPLKLDAIFTLGVAYQMAGRNPEAIELLGKIIDAAPHIPHSYRHYGMALQGLGKESEAKTMYEKALSIDPEYAEAMGSLANLLMKHYHFDIAETLILSALNIKPEMNDVRNNLARLYQLQGYAEKATGIFRDVLKRDPENRQALSNLLYSLCYLYAITPEEASKTHFDLCGNFFGSTSFKPAEDNVQNIKIRIGYIGNDFCLHSVSFFIEPVLLHHDRKRFEIFCYSNCQHHDETTERIQKLELNWRNISSLSAEEAAFLIRNDHIDILVDLSGHTSGNRLDVCALKPAPVMASWIGYPHSTGMKVFDYYISDPIADPPGMTGHLYVETVARLPRVFSCYLPPMEFPQVAEAPHLSNGYVTFGSFNNLAKVNPATIRLWSEILLRVPDSRIFLKSASLGGDSARNMIFESFAHHGISRERIILKVHAPTPFDHLKLYSEIDLALDTFPYNGTTTTCEALWMGVPVVTLAGRTHHSRVSASFLAAIGIPELIADTEESFVHIAEKLAFDTKKLLEYRGNLRSSMAHSPLMDYSGVTADVEAAYSEMSQIYKNNAKGEL